MTPTLASSVWPSGLTRWAVHRLAAYLLTAFAIGQALIGIVGLGHGGEWIVGALGGELFCVFWIFAHRDRIKPSVEEDVLLTRQQRHAAMQDQTAQSLATDAPPAREQIAKDDGQPDAAADGPHRRASPPDVLGKYDALKQTYTRLRDQGGADPFAVAFDALHSPTQAVLAGRPVLLLGTDNYLGLTSEQTCLDHAGQVLRAEGTGTTGSRIAGGTHLGHTALEAQIARFLDRRYAMLFSTGYQAMIGGLSALAGRDDYLFLDADSHPSIYDGARLSGAQVTRFRHNDPDDLHRRLRLMADRPGNKLIMVEGIYSMLGDVAPLAEIAAVKRETGAVLLVNEAHSLGVLGAHGRGLTELADTKADVDFLFGSFSKSLGAIGGFIAADLPDFNLLRLVTRTYMFTASLPPAVVAGVSQALQVLQAHPGLRQDLARNAARLYQGLARAGFALGPTISPIVSLRLPDPATTILFWNRLLEQGIYVNLALPPCTPEGLSLLRTSVSAAHSNAELDQAIDVITRTGLELGVLGAFYQAQGVA